MVKNKEVEEAKKELISLSQDEENQRIADFRERELRDKIDIYETGKDEERETIITNLLKMKMPIDKIIEATNATKEEIDKIRKRENI